MDVALAFLLFFLGGIVIGRASALSRPRSGLLVGDGGLDVDRAVRRAVRRPELRNAFNADRGDHHGR